MSQCYAEITFLVLAIDSGHMPVFLALKVLREIIISMIQLTIFKLALK